MLGDLQHYWSASFLAANAFIGLNLMGALLLGMLVGYERSYNGRAAGMRTYGLVCMASTALTVFVGHASLWYGGTTAHIRADPAHTIQGVITGIGFLCAGVIMKDGMSVRGLTTAASIWAVATTGVLLGVGFYAAALMLAVLCVASMSLVHPLESRLPGRMTFDVSLMFQPGEAPDFNLLIERARSRGYRVLNDTLTITYADQQALWRVSLVAPDKARALSPAALSAEMAATDGVSRFSIVPVRS